MVLLTQICCGLMLFLVDIAHCLEQESERLVDFPRSDHQLLKVVDPTTNDLEGRQAGLPTQHNISEVIIPVTTGRWTASIEAQLQPSQMDISTLRCTLSICAGPTLCGAAKSIGRNWSTFLLKIQLRAREAQTISFVTSCSTPAYVAVRNIVIPGQSTGLATITAVQTATSILPANTVTSTVVSVETGNAALGLAGSIIMMNSCENTWMTIYGDDDFEHIPPKGVAIVPAEPIQRFGAGVTIQSQAGNSVFCVTSSTEEYIGCAGLLRKRQIEPEPGFHPTHPLFINQNSIRLEGYTFQFNDIIRISCMNENYRAYDDQQTIISISNTGCGGVTMSGLSMMEDGQWYDVNMAYAGNTAANLSLRYPARIEVQTWSRNEPGWLEGTYSSVDGAALVNSAFIIYSIEDESPHSFNFVCNYTTRNPSGAMTQVVYSTQTTTTSETTTTTETDTQWYTSTEFITTTETTTERTTEMILSTVTESTTEFLTTTEFATTTCAIESTTETSTTTSESSEATSDESTTEPTSEPSQPTPPPPPPPAPREYWQLNVYNNCPLKTYFPVIVSQPQVSIDSMLFTKWDSAGLTIVSDDANPTFFLITGDRLCATSMQTGQQWCGNEMVTTHIDRNFDRLTIDCAPPYPSPPDMENTITINLRSNVGSSPAGCNYFAYQIGCEPGDYCIGQAYENNNGENNAVSFIFPMLSPGAKLRVRQTNTPKTVWRVYTSAPEFGAAMSVQQFTQLQGHWFDVFIRSTATAVRLEASCFYA